MMAFISTHKHNNKKHNTFVKYISISFACILVIAVIIGIHIFKTNYKRMLDDSIIAVYLGSNKVDNVPAKGSSWVFDHAVCSNNEEVTWDNITWSMKINSLSNKTRCKLYFVSKRYITDQVQDIVAGSSSSTTDIIDKGTGTDDCTITLAYDGTSDNNLRYVGKNPCNFVRYNGELWRIIGVMKNVNSRNFC